MFKKIMVLLAIVALGTGFLSGCKSSTDITNGVSPTDLNSLLTKKAEAIAKTPGWLHVTENIVYDIDKENTGVLPNGTVLPLEQISETWYHVNEQGKVYQYVNTSTTTEGQTIQVSVFMDNVIVNLTTNYVVAMNPYSLGALDYRFSNEMQDYMTRIGKTPALRITDVDGRQAAIFTIEETLDPPTTTDNYTEPVHGVRTVAYFDMDTGLLFQLERYRIFKDGSERTYYRTDITVEPNATPPQDILDYMNRIN
jgi:hypothetical protein